MFFTKVHRVLSTAIVACSAFALSSAAYGHEHHSNGHHEEHAHKTAYDLVDNFWRAVQHQNVDEYSRLLAHGFQGMNLDGHYNRTEQISGLENLTLRKYKIRDLIAAQYGDTLVISYDLYATGDGFTPGPSIDIWHKIDCRWEQVSHTYVPFPELTPL